MTPEPRTELEHAAAETWLLLVAPTDFASRAPAIPIGVALDRVQDATASGERAEAVSALLRAAADWLAGRMPAPDARAVLRTRDWSATSRVAGDAVGARLRVQDFVGGEAARDELRQRTIDARLTRVLRPRFVSQAVADAAAEWGAWCAYARLVLEFACRLAAAELPADRVVKGRED